MKKNKMIGLFASIFVVMLIAFLAVTGNLGNTGFTLYNKETMLPNYWSAECSTRADHMAQITLSHTDEGRFYHCTTKGTGKWIPIVNGVQCLYTVERAEISTAYICSGTTDNKADLSTSKCSKVSGGINLVELKVNAGDTLYLNTGKIFGDATLKAKYPSYGLKVTQADGFKAATTTSCIANSIESVTLKDTHTLDLNDRIEVLPDAPFNAVTRYTSAKSTQLVTLQGVDNGNPIYISRPGFYVKISQAEDGTEFVDTRKEYTSSAIQCIPRTVGCSDDAKFVKLVDQSCDQYGGAITGYSSVQGDSTKLCKYSCSGGKLQLSSDCIAVASSCPAEKPLWDTTTGKCVTLTEKEPETAQDLFYIYVLGFTVLAILAIIIWRLMQK